MTRTRPFRRFAACSVLAALLFAGIACVAQDVAAGASGAAAPSDGTSFELPAARIISMLQQDPDLLAEVKGQVARILRDQGQDAQESDISDSVLFRRIEHDASARARITDTLVKEGYVDADDPQLVGPGPSTLNDVQRDPGAPLVADAIVSRPPARTAPALKLGDEPPLPPQQQPAQQSQPHTSRAPAVDDVTGAPVRQVTAPLHLQALQDLYDQAVTPNTKLKRFGADLFQAGAMAGTGGNDLPAGPDYVLGSGDVILIEMWGSLSRRLMLTVDREGKVPLPEVGPVEVAGKSLAQATDSIQRALSTEFQKVQVDVSLGRLRSVRIYVVGDVVRPGAYSVGSLSTPLNALYAAGGPTDRGSLRRVRHLRGDQLIGEVDLYDLLLNGIRRDGQRLQPGDTILVPPVGPQVAIAGMVRRPAIYELKGETDLAKALQLAGGLLVSADLDDVSIERVEAHERRVMLSLNAHDGSPDSLTAALSAFPLQDGDRVTIPSIPAYSNQAVYVDGHVLRPGRYPYRTGMQVTDVIRSYQDLLPEPSERAEIIRLRPPDFSPTAIQFNLTEMMEHKISVPLQPFDTVRIHGRYEADTPKVAVFGEVLRPGEYPLTADMSAADLVRMAGGFKRSAYRDTADLSSYEISAERAEREHRLVEIEKALEGVPDTDVRLKPGDVLTIRQLAGWDDIGGAATISGEVLHPGTYGIDEGERLSSLLRRAGGFRGGAYPAGAVLERVQVRQMDRRAQEALIRRIEGAVPRGETAAFLQQQQQILGRLKQQPPAGRQVIHVSGDISKWENTPADIDLRAGDVLIIPKRPDFVLVHGQVNNPSAMTYVPGKNAGWYLRRAGGTTEFGNRSGVFVVRADGSVVGNGSDRWWGGNVLSTVMAPGDTLVVPEKILSENSLWKNLLNTGQLMSSVAIAARVATSF